MDTEPISLTITINAPIEIVWRCWTEPEYITQWAFAHGRLTLTPTSITQECHLRLAV